MSAPTKARAALAVATAAGGIGVAVGYGGRSLLRRQAATARRLIGKPLGEEALDADKVYRKRYAADPVELLVVGDSIAAGLGADQPGDTFGARLAKKLAAAAERPVRLRTVAEVGAESSMLEAQLDDLPEGYRPDVAVVIVGGNDVTHRVPVAESAEYLRAAVRRLRGLGAGVVVGTCPDLGALRPVPQPLRSLGSRASRQLAEAQRAVALAAGAYAVSLADAVGPFFITNPDEMFSLDRFHPSAAGYKRTAKAVLPSVLAALGHADDVPFGHHAPEPASPVVEPASPVVEPATPVVEPGSPVVEPGSPVVEPVETPGLRIAPEPAASTAASSAASVASVRGLDDWGIDDQVDGSGFDRREA